MTADITWRPEVGDPTLIGWLTVIVYGVAALLCAWAGRRIQSEGDRPTFWFVLAAILLLLGLNKQLDVQTLLFQFARGTVLAFGWYGQRRLLQTIFVVVLGALIMLVFVWMTRKLRPLFKQHHLVLPGCILLTVYVFLRAVVIDHLDQAFGLNLEDATWPAVIELLGILCFIAASARVIRDAKKAL